MKNYIKISRPILQKKEHEIELSATISASDSLFDTFKLWYRFPFYLEPSVSTLADPFLVVALPVAMQKGYDLVIKALVSERLYIQTRQIMKILSAWFESMEPINNSGRIISTSLL